MLDELPLTGPKDVTLTVRDGVVTLGGTIESSSQRQQALIAAALRLTWNVDGVVNVVNKLGDAKESTAA